jgi:peptidyl-tRNA hydrolase
MAKVQASAQVQFPFPAKEEAENIIMYMFINSDLELTSGQVGAQCGHIVTIIMEEIMRSGYEQYPPGSVYVNYMKWKHAPVKIVLAATTDQLIKLKEIDGAKYFIDNGPRLPQDALTVVGFPPGHNIKYDAKKYRLL